MLIRILKLPLMAFTKGHIYGYPITRNPIAWIPFFLITPVVLAIYCVLCVTGFLISPLFLLIGMLSLHLWKRKAGIFSDQGVSLGKTYKTRMLPWSDIREVIYHRQPTSAWYEIVCCSERFLLSWTQDDEAFERLLQERGISLRISDWRTPPSADSTVLSPPPDST
jgi:hypothetical protein